MVEKRGQNEKEKRILSLQGILVLLIIDLVIINVVVDLVFTLLHIS